MADLPIPQSVDRWKWRVLGAIAAGGALGTCARAGLGVAFQEASPGFPSTTLVINLVGSFILGYLVTLFGRRPVNRLLGPLLTTGFLGGFTTFSTFAVDAVTRTRDHRPAVAVALVAASILGGLLTAVLGVGVGKRTGAKTAGPVSADRSSASQPGPRSR